MKDFFRLTEAFILLIFCTVEYSRADSFASGTLGFSPLSMRNALPEEYFSDSSRYVSRHFEALNEKMLEDMAKQAEDFSGWNSAYKMRPDISGAYRTKFGTQIHPHCFEQWKNNGNRSEKELSDAVEFSVSVPMSEAMSCSLKYPELREDYLKPMVRQLQRSILLCMKDSEMPEAVIAFNTSMPLGLRLRNLEPEEKSGLDFTPGDDLANLPQQYKTTIVMRENDTRNGVLNDSVLFHEALHSTGANNQSSTDHSRTSMQSTPKVDWIVENGVEKIKGFHEGEGCNDSLFKDRVYFIEQICSKETRERVLFDMISLCGFKWCTNIFTHSSPSFIEKKIRNNYSKDLSENNAASLCEKAYRSGYCQGFMDDKIKALSLSNPKIQTIRAKLRQRFESLLSDSKVSSELLENSGPEIQRAFEGVRNTRCFKQVFLETGGGFLLRSAKLKRRVYFESASDYASSLKQNISKDIFIERGRGCTLEETRKIEGFFDAYAGSAVVSAAYSDSIKKFIENSDGEALKSISSQEKMAYFCEKKNSDAFWRTQCGDDLVRSKLYGPLLKELASEADKLYEPFIATQKNSQGKIIASGLLCEKMGLDPIGILDKIKHPQQWPSHQSNECPR